MYPVFVFIAAAIGNLTSDTLWYTAGLMGKMDWLFRFGKRLGIKPGYLERLESVPKKARARDPVLFQADDQPNDPGFDRNRSHQIPLAALVPICFRG